MANLVSLPTELLLHILGYLDAPIDVNALSRTSRYFNYLFNPELYSLLLESPSKYDFLQKAASDGRTECVRALLKHGVPVNFIKDPRIKTLPLIQHVTELPIYKAAERGHVDMVRLLIEHGALTDMPDGQPPQAFKESLLVESASTAARAGLTGVLEILIEQGVLQHRALEHFITQAVKNGHIEIVKLLHRHQPEFKFDSENGRSFLELATDERETEMIAFLLEKGCSPYEPNWERGSALRIAAGIGDPIFRVFTENSVSPHKDNARLCLEAAIQGNCISVIQYFLRQQKEFRIQDRSLVKMLGDINPKGDITARLMLSRFTTDEMDHLVNHGGKQRRKHLFNAACISGDGELLGRLFHVDDHERTGPGTITKRLITNKLIDACRCDNAKAVRALLSFERVRSEHVEVFSSLHEESLLTYAVRREALEVIEALLDNEIYDTNRLSERRINDTASIILKNAVSRGWHRLAKFILTNMRPRLLTVSRGAFIQRAVAGGYEMLMLLRESGTLLNPNDQSHWTALQIAVELGKFAIVSEFLRQGFDLNHRWCRKISFSPLVITAVWSDEGNMNERIEETLSFYLRRGASIETRFGKRQTPILQLIEMTPDRGNQANPLRLNRIKTSILHLLRWGADPFTVDSSGDDLLSKAARSPHPEFARTIMDHFLAKYKFDTFRKSLMKAAPLASFETSRWLWRIYWDHMYEWDSQGKIISAREEQTTDGVEAMTGQDL